MSIRLSVAALSNLPESVKAPAYGREGLRAGILHFGVGNFHRAHQAVYLDALFSLGQDHDWAIIGAGRMPADAQMRDGSAGQDWLTTVVEQDNDRHDGPRHRLDDRLIAPDDRRPCSRGLTIRRSASSR